MTHEKQLDIISRVWGIQDDPGYVFLPWIDGTAETKEQRIRGYHEDNPFYWDGSAKAKREILQHMATHEGDDLYWCPVPFETGIRRMEFAMDEHALWADLDEVDPEAIDEEFRPTVAWETSPGRFQGLWVSRLPMLGTSWPGGENQRLTYYLGADRNGWDTTQLLRVPGWRNHKPAYRRNGKPVQGRILWHNGPKYSRRQFEDLPDVQSWNIQVGDLIEGDVDKVDIHEVWGKVRLKVSKRVRDFIAARESAGDRSEILWEICRELADAGCTVVEIVAITRQSVWNKYSGRADELLRLSTEAAKAIEDRPESADRGLEEVEKPQAVPSLFEVLTSLKPPRWLIKDIWTIGSCGFISGQPKSWKSFFAFDMALSIATGASFLNHFRVEEPGPVLWIQEEDPGPVIKQRFQKMRDGKGSSQIVVGPDGMPWVDPGQQFTEDPDIGMVLKKGFILSDEGWQDWLKDKLDAGFRDRRYQAVILDPMMMMLGDVDDHRAAQVMDKVLRPLKVIASELEVAIMVIHHTKKADPGSSSRGGQLMLGSVANHAWTEDALYLVRHTPRGKPPYVQVEVESKSATGGSFQVHGLNNGHWTPHIQAKYLNQPDDHQGGDVQIQQAAANGNGHKPSKLKLALDQLGAGEYTTTTLREQSGISRQAINQQMKRLGYKRNGHRWIVETP